MDLNTLARTKVMVKSLAPWGPEALNRPETTNFYSKSWLLNSYKVKYAKIQFNTVISVKSILLSIRNYIITWKSKVIISGLGKARWSVIAASALYVAASALLQRITRHFSELQGSRAWRLDTFDRDLRSSITSCTTSLVILSLALIARNPNTFND